MDNRDILVRTAKEYLRPHIDCGWFEEFDKINNKYPITRIKIEYESLLEWIRISFTLNELVFFITITKGVLNKVNIVDLKERLLVELCVPRQY